MNRCRPVQRIHNLIILRRYEVPRFYSSQTVLKEVEEVSNTIKPIDNTVNFENKYPQPTSTASKLVSLYRRRDFGLYIKWYHDHFVSSNYKLSFEVELMLLISSYTLKDSYQTQKCLSRMIQIWRLNLKEEVEISIVKSSYKLKFNNEVDAVLQFLLQNRAKRIATYIYQNLTGELKGQVGYESLRKIMNYLLGKHQFLEAYSIFSILHERYGYVDTKFIERMLSRKLSYTIKLDLLNLVLDQELQVSLTSINSAMEGLINYVNCTSDLTKLNTDLFYLFSQPTDTHYDYTTRKVKYLSGDPSKIRLEPVVDLFVELQKKYQLHPNVYIMILIRTVQLRGVVAAHVLFSYFSSQNLIQPNLVSYTLLIKAFIANRQVDLASKLFDRMVEDSTISVDGKATLTMLYGYSLTNDLNKVETLLRKFNLDVTNLGLVGMTTLLRSAAFTTKDLGLARQIYQQVLYSELQPDFKLINTLLKAYQLHNDFKGYDQFKEELTEPNKKLELDSYGIQLELTDQVKSLKLDDAYNSLQKLLQDKNGLGLKVYHQVLVLLDYQPFSVDRVDRCIQLLSQLKSSPNTFTLNLILRYLAKNNQTELTRKVYNLMVYDKEYEFHVIPDKLSFISMIELSLQAQDVPFNRFVKSELQRYTLTKLRSTPFKAQDYNVNKRFQQLKTQLT